MRGIVERKHDRGEKARGWFSSIVVLDYEEHKIMPSCTICFLITEKKNNSIHYSRNREHLLSTIA